MKCSLSSDAVKVVWMIAYCVNWSCGEVKMIWKYPQTLNITSRVIMEKIEENSTCDLSSLDDNVTIDSLQVVFMTNRCVGGYCRNPIRDRGIEGLMLIESSLQAWKLPHPWEKSILGENSLRLLFPFVKDSIKYCTSGTVLSHPPPPLSAKLKRCTDIFNHIQDLGMDAIALLEDACNTCSNLTITSTVVLESNATTIVDEEKAGWWSVSFWNFWKNSAPSN